MPKYDEVEGKAEEIFRYFGSLDPTNPLGERRAQIFGLLRDDNKDALKKAYLLAKRFMNLIGSMEKMRKSYHQKKSTYDASKNAKFDKESSESYTVSVPSLESLEADELYKILLENVHKINSLEIKSVGKDARFTAFERFLRLCRSMDHLKTLKITAPWGFYASGESFFNPKNSVKGSVLSSLDPKKNMLTNEEQLLGAIAVIPNLEEIHLLQKASIAAATLPEDSFEHYWAAVGNCTIVELPIFINGPTLLRRICQSDDLKTKKRHFILTAYEGTSILEKLSDGLLEVVGQLLMAGKGKVTVQFGGSYTRVGSYTSFAKEMKIRDPLFNFYHSKATGAKPLSVEWMEEETDKRWPEFLKEKEIALGKDPVAFLTQKEITLDMFQKNIGTFMEISSVVTIEWANEVSDAFFGKKKNSKYATAFNFGYFSEAKTIEEYKKEQQELLIREKTKGIREKTKKEEEQWRKAHSTVSEFQQQLKKLPIFLPGEGIEWCDLPEDERRYPMPFYYLSPLVLAASLHLDADDENYYFFNVKNSIGTVSFDLVFPGIADGPLFGKYRETGRVLEEEEEGNIYDRVFFYGKKFTGKACSGYTAAEALVFSAWYDTVVLNEIQFYDVLRPYLPLDFNKKPKIMQLLAKLKLEPGVTIRHQNRRQGGDPTEEMLIKLIRTLKSGFEVAEKLKPMEKTIGEYKKSLFDLNTKEIDKGALSPSEKSQKTKLEKDIADLGKYRDPLAGTLKSCCVLLENQESYIHGLMEMIRIYKTHRKFCRVELDGTVTVKEDVDWFDLFSNPAPGETTTPNPNPAPEGGNVGSQADMFGANAGGMAGSAFTYPERVQKWKDNGRKIKYVSFMGVVSEHIEPNERTRITLPLSASDPKKARSLKKGEEANKDAVERFVLSGQINIVEEKDPVSGLGTGKYYVRFSTCP